MILSFAHPFLLSDHAVVLRGSCREGCLVVYILLHYVYSPVPQPGSLGPRCARLCQSCLVFELIHSDHVTSLRDEHCEKWLSRYFFSRITFPKVYPCFVLKATPERIWSGVRARATALLRYLVNLLVPFVPGPESIWLLQRVSASVFLWSCVSAPLLPQSVWCAHDRATALK